MRRTIYMITHIHMITQIRFQYPLPKVSTPRKWLLSPNYSSVQLIRSITEFVLTGYSLSHRAMIFRILLGNHTNSSNMFHHWQHQGSIWRGSGEYIPFKYSGDWRSIHNINPQPPNIEVNYTTTPHIYDESTADNYTNVISKQNIGGTWCCQEATIWWGLAWPENSLFCCYTMWWKTAVLYCEIQPDCSGNTRLWRHVLDSPSQFVLSCRMNRYMERFGLLPSQPLAGKGQMVCRIRTYGNAIVPLHNFHVYQRTHAAYAYRAYGILAERFLCW